VVPAPDEVDGENELDGVVNCDLAAHRKKKETMMEIDVKQCEQNTESTSNPLTPTYPLWTSCIVTSLITLLVVQVQIIELSGIVVRLIAIALLGMQQTLLSHYQFTHQRRSFTV